MKIGVTSLGMGGKPLAEARGAAAFAGGDPDQGPGLHFPQRYIGLLGAVALLLAEPVAFLEAPVGPGHLDAAFGGSAARLRPCDLAGAWSVYYRSGAASGHGGKNVDIVPIFLI